MARFFHGLGAFPRGVGWLFRHPRYLLLSFVPLVIGIVFFVGFGTLLISYHERIVAAVITFSPESWYGKILFYLLRLIFDVSLFVLLVFVSFLLVNIIASPFYDLVSLAVEKSVRGKAPELSTWQAIRLIGEEIKKVAFILGVTLALLVIPGVNLLATPVAAFLAGWEFFDYPVARRGWTFGARLRQVRRDGWAVLGFGLWLMIPLIQLVTMPLAVAGGTLLALESLPE